MNKDNRDDQFELYDLREDELDPSPFVQFGNWFGAAQNAGLIYPNAFTLATSGEDRRPSARMLLLKDYDEKGFVFYTNSESKKGSDFSDNPNASICFWWGKLERQVRIEGDIELVDESSADSYFASRPRGSQIGAWASPQSSVIESREVLDKRYNEIEKQYRGKDIPRPAYWQGYILVPRMVEFWQGRPDRLHDRLRYRLEASGNWVIERLAP
jgi:pyridoxamine 5'-phosphate oxidase